MKRCTKCRIDKILSEFWNDKSTHDGLSCHCKKCRNIASISWCERNKEQSREIKKRWYKNNKKKAYASTNRWKKKVPEKIKEWNRLGKKINPKRNYILTRLWLSKHPDKIKEYNHKKNIKKRSTPNGILETNMRTYVGRWLRGKKNGRRWEVLVGYTSVQLKKHLEEQFKAGMTWENYGLHGWHIDHIIPVSVFNFEKPEDDDFKRCWSLDNLQPLWAIDNIKKGNKINESFLAQLKQKTYRPASSLAAY